MFERVNNSSKIFAFATVKTDKTLHGKLVVYFYPVDF